MAEGFERTETSVNCGDHASLPFQAFLRGDFSTITEDAPRRFLQRQLALQVFEANSPPAVAQSLSQHFMIPGHRNPFEDVLFRMFQ